MRFLDWLFARTPAPTDPAPTVILRITIDGDAVDTPFTPNLAAIEAADRADTQEPPAPAGPDAWAIKLDGPCDCGDAFCVLDYTDSSGAHSERRVSLKTVSEQNGRLYLNAFCFERSAPRQFRLDRINYFISEDGEVIEPVKFLQEVIGIALRPASDDEQQAIMATAAYLSAMRPGIAVLTAAARADGRVHIGEIDAIQIWSEREAMALHNGGAIHYPPTIEVIEAIARHIAMMRPLLPGLKTQIRQLKDWESTRIERLLRSLGDTINADGVVVEEEAEFVTKVFEGIH